MLVELNIRNVALIDEASLRFAPGFNVLTGETGAGKSILVHAIGMVLGDRANGDIVRQGAEEALVEGIFDLTQAPLARAWLDAAEMLDADDPAALIVSRQVAANGRSRARVNGHTVNLASLRELGECIVDLHGQHEHQSLLHVANHLRLLDEFGGSDIVDRLAAYRQVWQELQTVDAELRRLQSDEQARAQRVDMLQFQKDEIAAVHLEDVHEEETLREERQRLANVELLREGSAGALLLIDKDEDGALDAVSEAVAMLEKVAHVDAAMIPCLEAVQGAFYQLDEARRQLRGYVDDLEADPQRLETVEARLHQLKQITRKYGPSLQDVMDHGVRIAAELEALTHSDERIAKLDATQGKLRRELATQAKALTRVRKEAAERFTTGLLSHLRVLALDKTRFVVEFRHTASPSGIEIDGSPVRATETGVDDVEFLFAANPGHPLRPLAKIASGGEISRVMLALKSALAANQAVPVLIFDEIDTGIGGATADAVGEKMRQLSAHAQVLCVTHLAQIASRANHHCSVTKASDAQTTRIAVSVLDDEARVEELAKMMGGRQVSRTSREHARELLSRGGEVAG